MCRYGVVMKLDLLYASTANWRIFSSCKGKPAVQKTEGGMETEGQHAPKDKEDDPLFFQCDLVDSVWNFL